MNSSTVRSLLVRGMLAGLVAGLFTLVTAYFLGEPHIDAAIAYEEAHSHEHGGEPPLVTRGMQATAGLATAVLVYGVAIGGIASLAFSFALGRVGRFGPRATALLLSGAAFVCVYLVPFLKYPANPPSVGDPASLDKRTALYFLMVLLSVLLAVAATILGRRLAPRLGNWYATVAAAGGFAFAVGLAYAFLPFLSELPDHFPALLLWEFRVTTLAVHLVLWTAFGLTFGHLAERALGTATGAAKTAESPAAAPAAN